MEARNVVSIAYYQFLALDSRLSEIKKPILQRNQCVLEDSLQECLPDIQLLKIVEFFALLHVVYKFLFDGLKRIIECNGLPKYQL